MRLVLLQGDITTLAVDAIVNAANHLLKPGGGVCGAIHRAAGPRLEAACAELGGCSVGSARLTPGFGLPARFVIHAVGPVWRNGEEGEAEELASAYREALALCDGNGLRTVAFPLISTGIYGYPMREACRVAVRAVLEWGREHRRPEQALLVAFDGKALDQLRRAEAEARRDGPERPAGEV
jgi:O-acetyl-ADP-ribose deacetylase